MDKLKLSDLHYRHQMLIKYKGYSIAAQTIIPGYQEDVVKLETDE